MTIRFTSKFRSRDGGLWIRYFLIAGCLLVTIPALAAKTDVVVLNNGDRITGEIKSLNRGLLTYSTDHSQTIEIKWTEVVAVTSPAFFLVERKDGRKFYGALPAAEGDWTLIVALDEDFVQTISLAEVVRITPIKETFWQRVKGHVQLGFSYTRSSGVGQLTFDGKTHYRDRMNFGQISLNSIFTSKNDGDDSGRADFFLDYQRTLKGRWISGLSAGTQTNDELNLNLRVLTTVSGGYHVIQTNSQTATVTAGFTINREYAQTGEETSNNAEIMLGTRYALFFYNTPKTDLTVDLNMFPSLTVEDRIRFEANVGLQWEIIKDFTVGLSYYLSYDRVPPGGGEASRDYGIVTSVGLKW